MITVRAYKCEFCPHGRPYASITSCRAHEEICFDNPATKSCATCKHLHRFLAPIEGKPGYVKRAYKCLAKKPGDPLKTQCSAWRREVDRYE